MDDNYVIAYIETINVNYFKFWAGARERMRDATDEQREAVYDRIKWYCDRCYLDNGDYPTATDINDIVWFGCDDIFFPEESEDE